MANTLSTVKSLQQALVKETSKSSDEESSSSSVEKVTDLLQELNKCNVDLKILQETLVGKTLTTVKKTYKNSEAISQLCKDLKVKWKKIADQVVEKQPQSTAAKSKNKTEPNTSNIKIKRPTAKPPETATKPEIKTNLQKRASFSSINTSNWDKLPTVRKNIRNKFLELFSMDFKQDNNNDFGELIITRVEEVEEAMQNQSGSDKSKYTAKARQLTFNLKKNKSLRDQVVMGVIDGAKLVNMSSEQLATEETQKEREKLLKSVEEARRLDWDEANEAKINEMCGIKGDLLKASLFTCGRCKSTKTTSTQKQTRSADEPMTVFVWCMTCGNRWKC